MWHHKVKPSYKILSSNTMLSLSSDVNTTKLLSLDLVRRALGLPKSSVPYPNWGVDGRWCGEVGRGNGKKGGSGNWIGM